MSDQPENLILAYLRRLDAKMDVAIDEVRDLQRRMTSLEENAARLHGDISGVRADYAGMQLRLDRIDGRIEHIEHRLDL